MIRLSKKEDRGGGVNRGRRRGARPKGRVELATEAEEEGGIRRGSEGGRGGGGGGKQR